MERPAEAADSGGREGPSGGLPAPGGGGGGGRDAASPARGEGGGRWLASRGLGRWREAGLKGADGPGRPLGFKLFCLCGVSGYQREMLPDGRGRRLLHSQDLKDCRFY